MNIDYLREVVDLSKTLSFTSTARHFYIAQPVLSRHVVNVENELGVELFSRTKNGIFLTEAGRIIISRFADLVARYDKLLEEARILGAGSSRLFRVGYLSGICLDALPEIVKSFRKCEPNIEVRFVSMELYEMSESLRNEAIDMAITINTVPPDPKRYSSVKLFNDTVCLVTPEGHRLSEKEAISFEDLRGETISVPQVVPSANGTSFIDIIFSPVIDSVALRRSIGDLNSVRLALLSEPYAVLEFMHLQRIYKDEPFHFKPFSFGVPTFDASIVWMKSNEDKELLELVECAQSVIVSHWDKG